jgi:hypothetical protein
MAGALMTLDLTDEETFALLNPLVDTIGNDTTET